MVLFPSQSTQVTHRTVFWKRESPHLKVSNQNHQKTSVDVTAIEMVIAFSYQASDGKMLLYDFKIYGIPRNLNAQIFQQTPDVLILAQAARPCFSVTAITLPLQAMNGEDRGQAEKNHATESIEEVFI